MKTLDVILDKDVCELCTTCTMHSIDKSLPLWKVERLKDGGEQIASTDPTAYVEGSKIKLRVLGERDSNDHYLCAYICPTRAITLLEDGGQLDLKYEKYREIRNKYRQ